MKISFTINFREFFLIVLIFHIVLLSLEMSKKRQREKAAEARPVKVRILNQDDHDRQIVQSEDPLTKALPKERARLSDKNRAFKRESKARMVKKFQNSDKHSSGPKEISLADLGGDLGRNSPFAGMANTASVTGTTSATDDFLPQVPLGDLTHLNTVEFKYYGYFHRIKEKLEGFWGRSVQEKVEYLASKGRSFASGDEHYTAVRLVLNSEGKIIEVALLGSSGVQEFDEAAIESFNEAGPFPNPPKSLIVDGRVTIEWGFNISS